MKKIFFVFGISILLFGCNYEIIKKDKIQQSKKQNIELETEKQIKIITKENQKIGSKEIKSSVFSFNEMKETEFYGRNSETYIELLDDKSLQELTDTVDLISKDEDFRIKQTLTFFNAIADKNKQLGNKIKELIVLIKNNKNSDDLFQQNTICSSLIANIKKELNTKEELDFIFFSPKLNTCIKVINSKEDYGSYESINYKKVYDANTEILKKTYRVSSDDDYKKPEEKLKSNSGKRNFIKFILENSNFNVKLLDNSSYIH